MNLSELPVPVFFILVFLAVLVVIGAVAWLLRRFGAERFGGTAARNRQPRLAVIDAASVDGRRRLVIIRRDNVEHLLMIGGPTDVVVETNIVRGSAAATAREAAPARAAITDPFPRAVPLGEGGQWPLQPQPEPSPSPRPHRTSIVDEVGHWATQPEQPPRPPRVAVEDDWPLQPQVEPPAPPLRAQREPPDLPRPMPAELTPAVARQAPEPPRAPEPPVTPPDDTTGDQNLAEMANRLEAALRRPVAPADIRTADTRPPVAPKSPVAADASARIVPERIVPERVVPEPRARKEPEAVRAAATEFKAERLEPKIEPKIEPKAEPKIEPKIEPARPAAAAEAKPAADVKPTPAEPKPRRVESKFGPPRPAQPKTLYDSLEQEMASLLGRPGPGGKS